MNAHLLKENLRRSLINKRRSLDHQYIKSVSELMINNIFKTVDLGAIKSVHTYLSLKQLKEPLTESLVSYIFKHYPNINLYIPVVTPEKLKATLLTPDMKLVKGRYNTLQTEVTQYEDNDFQFDLIIVPALAFDRNLYRLGYGKGYYDKFLANQAGYSIGLAYEDSLYQQGLPREDHDIALSCIVTEENIYRY